MTSFGRHNRWILSALTLIAQVALPAAVPPLLAAEPDVLQSNIYVSGQGGYHAYRIPALVVSTRGAILAFCECGSRRPYEWLRLARFGLPWLRQHEAAQ